MSVELTLVIAFFAGIFFTDILMKRFISKAVQKQFVVKDMYKHDKNHIPTMGGLVIMGVIVVSMIIIQVFRGDIDNLMLFYFIVMVYGLYGLTDDLFVFKKRYDKVPILFFLALPIGSLTVDTDINLIFMNLEVGSFVYGLIFAPMYIMVVANMINIHSGYNGLSGGLSTILLFTVALKSYLDGGIDELMYLIPILSSVIIFMKYNFYPAQTLLGNVGTYLLGGALGSFMVLKNMELFGVIILIPHIINFLMDTYTLRIRKKPLIQFGKLREDKTIEIPASMKFLSMKFFVAYYMRLTERSAVLVLYLITIFFCILGLALSRAAVL